MPATSIAFLVLVVSALTLFGGVLGLGFLGRRPRRAQAQPLRPAVGGQKIMNLLQAIRGRRAVRDFTEQSVPRLCLHQLASAASWAPSALNEQPWHFTVITDGAVLDEISERAKRWSLAHMPEVLRPAHFRDLMADPNFHLFHHAPAVVIISVPADLEWAREDCAAAAQNLMLAAVEMGLGTCWIGFAQDWLASAEGREML